MNGRFSSAIGEGQDWSDAAKDCLERLDPVPEANLGFLYVTDHLADQLGSILTLFRGVTGVDLWVGTVGLGVCGTGREVFDRPAVAAMLGTLPPNGFRLIPRLTDGLAPFEAAAGPWMADHPPLLSLIHADPRTPNLGDIVGDLAERAGFLVGGLASSRGEFPHLAGKVAEGGVSGVVFSADVPIATALTQGCSPIGPVRTVTAAERNVIMEIDGHPALEVFKTDIGELLARDLRRVAGYIFAGLPIPGSDTGDYLVRNLTGIDPARGWIAIGDMVEPGQAILFTRRDRAAAQQDLERMLAQLKRRLAGPAKGAVYVSCVARGPNLFGADSEELRTIQAALGDVPLAGFFANGEISNNRLYGYTGVLTLFT